MKRFAMAIALACALSGTGLAGDVHSTGSPEPAPPQELTSTGDSHTTGDSATPGDMPTVGVTLALLTVLDLVF